MRTTVTLSADVAAAVDRFREARRVGVSEAVNELVRRGLVMERPQGRFDQTTHRMDARIDVTNVWEAVETADGPEAR